MVEPEVAFGHLEDVMELAEGLLSFHRAARAREARLGPRSDWTRHREARNREGALPAHQLRRSRADAADAHTKG